MLSRQPIMCRPAPSGFTASATVSCRLRRSGGRTALWYTKAYAWALDTSMST